MSGGGGGGAGRWCGGTTVAVTVERLGRDSAVEVDGVNCVVDDHEVSERTFLKKKKVSNSWWNCVSATLHLTYFRTKSDLSSLPFPI